MLPGRSVRSHWIHTMYRCVLAVIAALVFVMPRQRAGAAQLSAKRIAWRDSFRHAAGNHAQRQRPRGLRPAARIRNQNNLIEMSGGAGRQQVRRATTQPTCRAWCRTYGYLRPDEIANKPWPSTAEEASTLELRSDRADLDQALEACDEQEGVHQDLRLPDERVRLGQDGARARATPKATNPHPRSSRPT